jgi:hypothetical protein
VTGACAAVAGVAQTTIAPGSLRLGQSCHGGHRQHLDQIGLELAGQPAHLGPRTEASTVPPSGYALPKWNLRARAGRCLAGWALVQWRNGEFSGAILRVLRQ